MFQTESNVDAVSVQMDKAPHEMNDAEAYMYWVHTGTCTGTQYMYMYLKPLLVTRVSKFLLTYKLRSAKKC